MDGSGAYTIAAVPTGTYFVNASATGFVNQIYNNISCGNCPPTNGTQVVVVAGVAKTNINFSLIATGTGSISGVVTDASTGLPPTFTLQVQVFNASGGNAGSTTTTLATGAYTFSGLATGSYYVRTNTGGSLINQLYPGVTCIQCSVLTTTGSTLVNVTNGATTNNINFALSPGGRISGTVTGGPAPGAPQSGVPVQVFNSAGVQTGSFTTNASGVYTTSGLPPGTYYLRSASNLHVNVQYNSISCPLTSCSVTAGTPVVVAGTELILGIDFALPSSGRISGTVTNAATAAPIQQVPVQIFSSAGISLGSVNTDASGNYITGGLPAGTYYARTNATGLLFQNNGTVASVVNKLWDNITCVPACLNPTAGTPITVALLATTTGVNFALESGGSISGTVTDAGVAGVGLGSIAVQIFTSAGVFAKQATTNSAGGYTVAGLPAGTYYARTNVPATQFYQDELFREMPCGAGCTVTTGSPILVAVGSIANGVDFTLDATGADDLTIDFGSDGLWTRYNDTDWALLNTASPTVMATGDLDGDGHADLIANFPGFGVWVWINNSGWYRLHTAEVSQIATGDMDGNGQDEVIFVFPGFGVWIWANNSGFYQLHAADPNRVITGDLDGNGLSEVVFNFRAQGIWVRENNATWSQLHTTDGTAFTVGDFDGGGRADLLVNFPGAGLWQWQNNTAWAQVHASNATVMTAGDIDASGQDDVIISFPGFGVWVLKNGTFEQLHITDAALMTAADVDGNGRADVVISFPGVGIWTWMNDTIWNQLHAQNPQGITSGNLDGN